MRSRILNSSQLYFENCDRQPPITPEELEQKIQLLIEDENLRRSLIISGNFCVIFLSLSLLRIKPLKYRL